VFYFKKILGKNLNLWIGELREERDDVVHEVLVVDDRVLALLDQQLDEVAKVGAKLLPELTRCHQRILAGLFLEFLKIGEK
jgi:hypothetical protein